MGMAMGVMRKVMYVNLSRYETQVTALLVEDERVAVDFEKEGDSHGHA